MKQLKKDKLDIKIFGTRDELGIAAAKEAAAYICNLLDNQPEVNILFAAAPSQNEFLKALSCYNIPWNRINAFHMDEYIGLQEDAPQRFGNYLKKNIFSIVQPKTVYYLFDEKLSPTEICKRYTELLSNYPLDIIFMGIGENAHIAFNDPHVADFNDPQMVKIVSLDEVCRKQQVHDGCFKSLDDVPLEAITLTIPAMMKAKQIFCIVPAATKANAIKSTVNGDITPDCPASILRTHGATTLYCDNESAKYLLL